MAAVGGYDMNAEYSNILKQAFVVGPSELKKLTNLLQDSVGEVKITAGCADGISRDFETVDSLINYENPKAKEIRNVRLFAVTQHSGVDSLVMVDLGRSFRGVDINFTGSEDIVSSLKEKTLDIIEGIRPWYNVLSRINFGFVFVILFGIAWPQLARRYESVISENMMILIILGFSLISLYAILWFVGNKLRDYFFPPAVFRIGQGKSRFKHKERVQWGVVICFIVSLATGLIIWLITL